MAKRGGTKHMKRIASPKAIPINDRKERMFLLSANPGPHPRGVSVQLGVFLRDILKVAKSEREVRRILSRGLVLVDGKIRREPKFPVGLMDIVSMPAAEKQYKVVVDWKARLVPMEISAEEAAVKLVRVTGKRTLKGGKLRASFHDGRNLFVDNHVRVGDSLIVSLPKPALKTHLKSDVGARCLVIEGKHAGSLVKLKEIIERAGGKPNEALVQGDKGEFITVAKYLFVVDDGFKLSG